MLSNVNPNVALIVAGSLILAVIGAVVALAWHGTVTGGDALTVIGGIVAIVATILGVHTGVNAGANAAKAPANTTPTA